MSLPSADRSLLLSEPAAPALGAGSPGPGWVQPLSWRLRWRALEPLLAAVNVIKLTLAEQANHGEATELLAWWLIGA